MRGAVLALALLAGCAGTKPYPSGGTGNVTVRADLDRGVRAALHVHSVDRSCATEYQGTVTLDGQGAVVAIPPDRPSYLVVVFDGSSFLRGSASTSVGTLLRPRAGQKYELAASYRASLYDVVLREGGREVSRRDLGACRAS
jgi:hypothetical protein